MIAPLLVPIEPDAIESQLLPDVTDAVQDMVPIPVLEMLNTAVPAFAAKFWVSGLTERIGFNCPLLTARA